MMVLITYDVAVETEGGKKRLRRVARICEDHGQRVQYSVFECELDPAQWARMRARLIAAIEPDHDSLRFYFLGREWRRRVEHIGAKPADDPDSLIMI